MGILTQITLPLDIPVRARIHLRDYLATSYLGKLLSIDDSGLGKNGPGKNGPGKNGPGKNGPEKTVRGIIGLVVESVKTVRSFR